MKIKISEDGTNANCRFGFDSCANIHYVGDRRLLHNYRTQSGVTIDGIGGYARVVGVGDLHLTLRSDDGSHVTCIVPDVFHVEGNYANILSMLLFKKQCKQAVKRVVIDDESSGSYFRLSNNSRVNLDHIDDLLMLKTTAKLHIGNKRTKALPTLHGLTSRNCSSNFSVFNSSRSHTVTKDYAHMVLCHPADKVMDNCQKHNLIKKNKQYFFFFSQRMRRRQCSAVNAATTFS